MATCTVLIEQTPDDGTTVVACEGAGCAGRTWLLLSRDSAEEFGKAHAAEHQGRGGMPAATSPMPRAWGRPPMTPAQVRAERRASGYARQVKRAAEAARLRLEDGLLNRQVAERMGVSVGRVEEYMRIARAEGLLPPTSDRAAAWRGGVAA